MSRSNRRLLDPPAGAPVREAGSERGSVRGRLAVVGIGPGALDQLTRAAEAELRAAEVLVGYRAYLERLSAGLAPGRREAFEIGEEHVRARRAVMLAEEGSRVALVSSGDPGVYGMASVAIQAVAARASPVELVVIPGVTAATAAAALLGAPLGVDFACVSLSDLLLPPEEVRVKVEGLAALDIVLAIYNPAGRTRRGAWEHAVRAIQRHRDASAPVATVRRAFQDGQRVVVCDVSEMRGLDVDMETIVVVGSSRTQRLVGMLATLREIAPDDRGALGCGR